MSNNGFVIDGRRISITSVRTKEEERLFLEKETARKKALADFFIAGLRLRKQIVPNKTIIIDDK